MGALLPSPESLQQLPGVCRHKWCNHLANTIGSIRLQSAETEGFAEISLAERLTIAAAPPTV
jgi:hypothetical protein